MGAIWSLIPKQHDELSHAPNYTGVWQSSDIPAVKGTLQAYLPFSPVYPPIPGKEYIIEMLVTYDQQSPYKPGWRVKMKSKGTVNQTTAGTATLTDPRSIPVVTKQSLTIISEDQKIGYQVNDLNNVVDIQGKYVSVSPKDAGDFAIQWIRPY